jgi:hypothetical protein
MAGTSLTNCMLKDESSESRMVFAFERMKRQHETSVKSQRPPSRDPHASTTKAKQKLVNLT